jgi:uncharacterized protein
MYAGAFLLVPYGSKLVLAAQLFSLLLLHRIDISSVECCRRCRGRRVLPPGCSRCCSHCNESGHDTCRREKEPKFNSGMVLESPDVSERMRHGGRMEYSSNMQTDAIVEAVKAGDAGRVRELLTSDPSLVRARTPEGVSVVCLAMYHRKPEIAEILTAGRDDLDLHEACTVGDGERVRQLVSSASGSIDDFSPDGFAPIALAAYFGHPEIVGILAAAGADVNAQARNPMKVAAIHAAVAARNGKAVDILLRYGADPNLTQQNDITPLQAAVSNKDEGIVAALTAAGAR